MFLAHGGAENPTTRAVCRSQIQRLALTVAGDATIASY